MREGIDLSAYQHPNGAAIDYQAVKDSGRSFAIVKVSDGVSSGVNPFADADISGFSTVGMQVVAYHFFEPDIPGQQQAQVCLDASHGLPIMLDAETGDPNLLLNELRSFVWWAQSHGRSVLDYTNLSWYGQVGRLGDATLLADPGVNTCPAGFDAWQYTWSGTVPGISGYVDLDRWLDDASYAQFFRLIKQPDDGFLVL